jgi:hypothetical protein
MAAGLQKLYHLNILDNKSWFELTLVENIKMIFISFLTKTTAQQYAWQNNVSEKELKVM